MHNIQISKDNNNNNNNNSSQMGLIIDMLIINLKMQLNSEIKKIKMNSSYLSQKFISKLLQQVCIESNREINFLKRIILILLLNAIPKQLYNFIYLYFFLVN